MKKTALVTGASRGIGQTIAFTLAAHGYDLAVCCSSNPGQLLPVQQAASAAGVRCLPFQADVSKSQDCVRMFEAIEKSLGGVDLLVNNAKIGLLQDMPFEEWERLISVNLSSVFYCCKLAIPGMVRKKQGTIINISSVWGVCGASCEAAYSASKGGVNALTMALAKELAPSGIQVNAIACGAIDTDMNRFLEPEERDALLEEIPAGRMGTPEEAAQLVLQLAQSPSYLTGQIIRLDGGWI